MNRATHILVTLALIALASCSVRSNEQAEQVISGGIPISTEALATRTTAELHLYADGTSGDDANDGLTVGTPKKTLEAVFALLPDIVKNNTAVHLSGTFSEYGHVYLTQQVAAGVTLLVDGGDEFTVVDDNGGAKYTAAAGSSTSALVISTTPWSTDQHFGYIARVLTGSAAGNAMGIYSNATDTIVPQRNLSADPTGGTFDIVRFATTLASSTDYSTLHVNTTGGGYTRIQRLYFSGTKSSLAFENTTNQTFAQQVISASSSTWPVSFSACILPSMFGVRLDSSTFSAVSSAIEFVGVSVIGSSGTLYVRDLGLLMNYGVLSKRPFNINSTSIGYFSQGCRLTGGVAIVNSRPASTSYAMQSASGYRTTAISNASGVGISLSRLSSLAVKDIDVSSCGSHGIEVVDSFLVIGTGGKVTTGTGNTGAGVYAHSGSVVHITDGTTPTITGTVGDFSTDGTTAATTWAAVDGGTPYTDASELTMVKEVP